MIDIILDGRVFEIAFRHTRYEHGATHALKRHAPVRAITTCVVIVHNQVCGEIEYVALGNAVCLREDQFSRHFGRHAAVLNAVTHCGALLLDDKFNLLRQYALVDPQPPAQHARPKLDSVEQVKRWGAGWEQRQRRATARQKGAARENFRSAIADEAAGGAS
jgi:hypothetical protein